VARYTVALYTEMSFGQNLAVTSMHVMAKKKGDEEEEKLKM
jgi:hypothetical protein